MRNATPLSCSRQISVELRFLVLKLFGSARTRLVAKIEILIRISLTLLFIDFTSDNGFVDNGTNQFGDFAYIDPKREKNVVSNIRYSLKLHRLFGQN